LEFLKEPQSSNNIANDDFAAVNSDEFMQDFSIMDPDFIPSSQCSSVSISIF